MRSSRNWAGTFAAMAAATVLVAGCGSDDEEPAAKKDSEATQTAKDPLGTPKKASGEPFVLGLLNLEAGPVTFPEYRQAAEAAAKYVNEYKGGIGGRPIKIEACATDGQPSTSARCAGQIVDKKPDMILGGADTGAPGAFPVYERSDVAYAGGIPFTPVESNAPNAVIFAAVSSGDNAANSVYAGQTLKVKKATVVFTDDTQGKSIGLGVIAPTLKNQGVEVKTVGVAPNAADLSATAASAIESNPDMVYVNSPNACPALLKALKSVGNTAKIAGLDPCASPQAIKAAGAAAEGLYFAQPFESIDSGAKDTNLMMAALKKFGEKDIALDAIAQAGFSSVMNIQERLNSLPEGKGDSKAILAAFKDGKEHPNFMAHPYKCDGKQTAAGTAVCNGFMKIKQIKGGKVVPASDDWVTGGEFYKPAPPR